MRHMTSQPPTPQAVREALEQTGGRVQEAADVLGISRVHLWRLRRLYGLTIDKVVNEKEAA